MVGLQERSVESAELGCVVERDQLVVDVASANLIFVTQVVIHRGDEGPSVVVIRSDDRKNAGLDGNATDQN